MTLRTFTIGLIVSFGLPLFLIVLIPYAKMRAIEPVKFNENVDGKEGLYHPKTNGRVSTGAEIYGANGCYQCHSQVVRPTYAGADVWRKDWGGLAKDPDRGDTRRESTMYDYMGEDYAYIGETRNGPDLSNFGRRVGTYLEEGEAPLHWVYEHMFAPRGEKTINSKGSTCPPLKFLFEERVALGQTPANAIVEDGQDGIYYVPNTKAKALASYLLSLKRDDAVPASMSYAPKKDKK